MDILSAKPLESEVVITLGTFDGVHLAHQKIIKMTINRAQELNCSSALFTFNPHPLAVVDPNKAPNKLTSWRQQQREIKKLGIDKIIRQDFTSQFSDLSYQEFIAKLNDYCSVQEIIVGEDFRCGHNGQGTPKKLAQLGEKFNFGVNAVPVAKLANKEIGSTQIRQFIEAGKLKEAKEQLGRVFSIDCKVVNGDQRGRKLGFPTANLKPVTNYVLPPCGVYACQVNLNNKVYPGVVNLGLRPTFAKDEFTIEVHLFNFNQDIYDARLELEFIEWIRAEEKYDNHQDLVSQIEKDITKAKKILNFS